MTDENTSHTPANTTPPAINTDEGRTFEELASDPELTQKDVEDELNRYAKALREEFERRTTEEPDEVEKHTHDFFKSNVHNAAAQIVWLSINAESETVKLNASKFIVLRAVTEEDLKSDPIKAIIEGLKDNDKNEQPANRED